jgi:hypothetical protein
MWSSQSQLIANLNRHCLDVIKYMKIHNVVTGLQNDRLRRYWFPKRRRLNVEKRKLSKHRCRGKLELDRKVDELIKERRIKHAQHESWWFHINNGYKSVHPNFQKEGPWARNCHFGDATRIQTCTSDGTFNLSNPTEKNNMAFTNNHWMRSPVSFFACYLFFFIWNARPGTGQ